MIYISVFINTTKAINLISNGYFGNAEKINMIFWTWLSIIFYIVGPLSLIWLSWYWMIIFIFLGMLFWKAEKRNIQEMVIREAMKDKDKYKIFISEGLIVIK